MNNSAKRGASVNVKRMPLLTSTSTSTCIFLAPEPGQYRFCQPAGGDLIGVEFNGSNCTI